MFLIKNCQAFGDFFLTPPIPVSWFQIFAHKKSADTSTLSKLADEEGFEPPIRVTPYTRFRVARIQPLCHSSIIILFFYNNFILPAYQNARPQNSVLPHKTADFRKKFILSMLHYYFMAERQRFELWEGSHPRRFSRPLH